jgi:hypothetical protein
MRAGIHALAHVLIANDKKIPDASPGVSRAPHRGL